MIMSNSFKTQKKPNEEMMSNSFKTQKKIK